MKKLFALCVLFATFLSVCPFVYSLGYSVVLEPTYNMAESFESGVTKVSKDSLWALADTDGKAVTSFAYEAIGDTVSDYIPAKKNGRWGYISPTGTNLIPFTFAQAGCFNEELALVKTNEGEFAYINKNGDVVFKSPFSYSYSVSGGAICGSNDGLYGFCDTSGDIFISPKFEMALDFNEGLAAVFANGKWGYIGTDGKYLILPAFDHAGNFENGYAICINGGKYGIINKKGAKLTPFTFDYIASADDKGRFPAKKDGTSGFINEKGEWLLKTSYDYCYKFTNGVARVYKNGLWGYIDENANEIVAPSLLDCGEYHKDRAAFSTDGLLWGYLTLDMSLDSPPKPVVTPSPKPDEQPSNTDVVPQNPAYSGDLPLSPDKDNCISMKIGSTAVLSDIGESTLSTAPVLLDGTTMVPVRDVVELMGGTVEWVPETKKIFITYKHQKIILTLNSQICFVNGKPTAVTKAPQLINSSTMIPLRNIVDSLSLSLNWIANAQNIYIYY